MDSTEARKCFLDYFERHGHAVVPSSSLVPADDPTLLFVNAGMVQFKDVFTGLEKRDFRRAASSQKCMRVSGKHNDLEDVGTSIRHNTFFEMLGNFSFGDYFKEKAIAYAWEFTTAVVDFDPERVWPTVYLDDDEAFQLWQDVAGVPAERITRLGKKDNFWSMGATGPCGPCSELIYDRGPATCTCARADCHLRNDDCDRWMEFWNLVFMQYNMEVDGTLTPLARPCVDTGLGLERLMLLHDGLESVYELDLFAPQIDRLRELTGQGAEALAKDGYAYRTIADHSRAITFLIADRIMPGNDGRSYILRLLMRRAIRFGKTLGLTEPFLSQIAAAVIDTMGGHYHELVDNRDFIMRVVDQEEERFQQTLASGLSRLEDLMAEMRRKKSQVIPGDKVFQLYDTHGFPHMLTRDVAREHGFEIDEEAFNRAMAEQRQRSRTATRFVAGDEEEVFRGFDFESSEFVGYETTSAGATVLALVRDGQLRDEVAAGEQVEVVLDRTPFYAEAGGQIGDVGTIEGPHGRMTVSDTQRPVPGHVAHRGRVAAGVVRTGDRVEARVDDDKRAHTERNHTATHLMHKALQSVLGSHARQAGSLVDPERLRFDFTHLEALSAAQIAAVEDEVNAAIRHNYPVHWEVVDYQAALRGGAMALFGEKYGDQVRVVQIADAPTFAEGSEGYYSRELCGGTHVRRTGDIGAFHVVSEGSIGTGIRRIEAVTGAGAQTFARQRLTILDQVAAALNVPPGAVAEQVRTLVAELDQRSKELDRLQSQLARGDLDRLLDRTRTVDGVKVLAARVEVANNAKLREMSDWVRDKLGSCVVVLGAVLNDKPAILVSVTPDLIPRGLSARAMAQELGPIVGGSGGGRDQFAQAGGREPARLPQALERAVAIVGEHAAPA